MFIWILGCGIQLCLARSYNESLIITQPYQRINPIRIFLSKLAKPYHTNSARKGPSVIPIPKNPVLQAPSGFQVNVFAENLANPRWLALTPAGDILVTETRRNQIRLLRDADGDGVADNYTIFAGPENGLNIPFGMTFVPDVSRNFYWFYLGNTAEVRRYQYYPEDDKLIGKGSKIFDLPGGGYNQHWTRNVVHNGTHLFVSVGSRSNADEEPLPRASVTIMSLDGSWNRTWAFGLRNPVGLDFHPITGELYTTVNERDGLGDDLVPDYFTKISDGDFYGWPYAYLAPRFLDPRHVNSTNGSTAPDPDLVASTKTPDVLFQAHSAALGLKFYDKDSFPIWYRNGAFVAFRGSWNRNQGTGYKIVFIPFSRTRNKSYGSYEDFITGFLTDPYGPTTWGRPVGLLVMPDGSLIFTEESNGRIYRVQYQRKSRVSS